MPGAFLDPDGVAVPVLDLKGITSEARGVAIVTPEVALKLVEDHNNISTDALAVVTIGDLTAALQGRETQALQWSAIHKKTLEPALVQGTLMQLGDLEVSKAAQESAPEMPTLETVVVRVQVHPDSYPEDWSVFARGPVKVLVYACIRSSGGKTVANDVTSSIHQ